MARLLHRRIPGETGGVRPTVKSGPASLFPPAGRWAASCCPNVSGGQDRRGPGGPGLGSGERGRREGASPRACG
ncbi:hypothetical protein ACFFX0_30650 [Citricoccus parietis]|uniref:Uncharacterized protein n=1 Tax=Citricoccus parietis TaxID=592307 RepID=A0ABV5G8L2_9MICC